MAEAKRKVVRLADLTPDQRRLVLTLIAAHEANANRKPTTSA